MTPHLRAYAETAVYGTAGATALVLLHVPAGALVGAMATVAIASLAGRPTAVPTSLQTVLFMVVGAAVGAAATPEALRSIPTWPISLGILAVSTVVMYGVGYWVFRRFGDCDPVTAFYAAAPGALSAVVVLAEAEGAVMSRVAAAQALRVACITAASPFLLAQFHLPPVTPHAVTGDQGWLAWTILILSSIAGWKIAERLKWPSPSFLGPMAISAALHAVGWLALAPPRPLVVLASAGLGAMVGTRFRGVDPGRLLRFLPPAAASFLAMGVIGLGAGWAAGELSGVGPIAGMLAFAPGSMDVLIAISLATAQSPAYVAAHHTARLLAVLAFMPLVGPHAAKAKGRQAGERR